LAAIEAVAGLSDIVKIVKIGAFVASAPGFTGPTTMINSAPETRVGRLAQARARRKSDVSPLRTQGK
jgi:hypothetical protein